ncbi:Fic family protein [Erwinia sp. QL-Z3]|uniref:Fic family protein n=1 Tax=Erwinia sp. QL-Z3 TaxID=2547962 RepID=UPI001070ACE0|nr:Fic family protein [Erwinia sp. QL-Z3]QBR49651.1 Fic family protein [Erwinia sp. QL-Z3]
MKIKRPPDALNINELANVFSNGENLSAYIEFMKPVDDKGRYLHWDSLRHRIPKQLDPELVWTFVKHARRSGGRTLPLTDKNGSKAQLYVTDFMQKTCSQVDRLTSSSAENELLKGLEERSYFIKDLFGEESISSSQLEGAATTTRVAQEMLQIKREPRDESERMIFGNYRMMQFVVQQAGQKMTAGLLKEIHAIGVRDINDAQYKPGDFRDHDDIVVEDTLSKDVIHQPPSHTQLDEYIETLCHWANEPHEKDVTGSYIHPLLKACVLHFMIGYIHPFCDGNGRTARALFYWYMLKCGYSAFRHISVSRLLKEAPVAYGKAYLQTETDDFDLTYFVSHQCETVAKAVDAYITHIKELIRIRSELDAWLWSNESVKDLNARQQQIMSVAIAHPGRIFSLGEAMENLKISYNTARTDFQQLAKLGLLKAHKEGKETVFIAPKNSKQAKKWSDAEPDLPKTTGW